eukprot:snap_masked-scaffold_24-processed-gene-5.45-mRNA-1 protein AED:1.00 eAED:1.00 QI:0/-1/0/0/-1/1/1/0/92
MKGKYMKEEARGTNKEVLMQCDERCIATAEILKINFDIIMTDEAQLNGLTLQKMFRITFLVSIPILLKQIQHMMLGVATSFYTSCWCELPCK